MGHDITGYRVGGSDGARQVAYLRRGAFNPLNVAIYDALECSEMYGGASGCGGEMTFTAGQLSAALDRLQPGDDYEPEREFLRKCIAVGGPVRITFY